MRRAAALAASLLLGGCIATQPPLRSSPIELADVPFYPQTAYQCGPAALATVLTDSGAPATPEEITGAVYIPERKGSLQVELVAAARRFGRLPFVIPPEPAALLAELEAGRPVLVLQNLAFQRFPRWHYAVVVGYEPGRDRFLLRSGKKERKKERSLLFLRSWRLAAHWGMVVVGPGELPASATPEAWAGSVARSESVLGKEQALAAYNAALSRWPDDPMLLFASANYRYGAGRPREALAQYRHLLSLEPGHAAARNNFANLLLDQGCVAQAQDEIGRALQALEPDDPLAAALQDTRAQADTAARAAPVAACALD
jgi:tetratricopeptide (TPR) repeat protein